jgi:hypothetical protein
VIRLVRLYTGADGQSHVEDGYVALMPEGPVNRASRKDGAETIYFEETAAGSSLDWHNDPHRRYVVTLAGTVEFETRLGRTFEIAPGDVLLAEDETGGGHRWRLVGDQPWRRVYIDVPRIEPGGGRSQDESRAGT